MKVLLSTRLTSRISFVSFVIRLALRRIILTLSLSGILSARFSALSTMGRTGVRSSWAAMLINSSLITSCSFSRSYAVVSSDNWFEIFTPCLLTVVKRRLLSTSMNAMNIAEIAAIRPVAMRLKLWRCRKMSTKGFCTREMGSETATVHAYVPFTSTGSYAIRVSFPLASLYCTTPDLPCARSCRLLCIISFVSSDTRLRKVPFMMLLPTSFSDG